MFTHRRRVLPALIFAIVGLACDRKGDAGSPSDPLPSAAVSNADNSPATTPLPTASDLLERAVMAQGGREKIEAIQSCYLEGKLEVLGQNISGTTKVWWQAGDFYVEQDLGLGMPARAGRLGDVIWAEDPINGLRRLSGIEAEQHMWATSLSLSADWQRYFARAETVGERELAGKRVYDVMLTAKSGSTVTLSFDAQTGLQVGQSFKQATPFGEMPATVELQDYRDVHGIKLAHVQVTDASLAKAKQTLTKVEFGVAVDRNKFSMPTGGAQVVTPATASEPTPTAPAAKPR